METIFTLKDNDELSEKINLDELYEKKQQYDLNTLNVYNKILNRIHNKIRLTSKQHIDNQHCWFLIPEVMIGVPRYDNGACIAYIIDKLKDNGFLVKYTHPNLLFISWKHYIPGYVRNEIKKKTGIIVDGNGKQINNINNEDNEEQLNGLVINLNKSNKQNNDKKEYKDINTYKPTGGLIYKKELFSKIEDKFS
jgi:hypothetical protein